MDLERSKLDTIFNYMAEGVVAIDKNNQIIHANIIAMDILNLTQEDILDNKNLDLKRINMENIDYKEPQSLEGGDEIIEINSEIYKIKHAPFKNEEDIIGGALLLCFKI